MDKRTDRRTHTHTHVPNQAGFDEAPYEGVMKSARCMIQIVHSRKCGDTRVNADQCHVNHISFSYVYFVKKTTAATALSH